METVIISGANGFIGRALLESFSKRRYNVIGFDTNTGDGVLYGDIRSPKIRDIIQKNSIVIHTASIAGVDNVLRYPTICMDTIITGSTNMANVCCEKMVKKIINFSTSEVLGNTAFGKIVELCGDKPLGVIGARAVYSNAKRAMENYMREMCRERSIPMVNIRPFNVFGPGQRTGGAIFRLINQCLNNETMEIRNHGSQVRSWTYIDDMVEATKMLVTSSALDFEDVSVGNPANTLSIDLLAKMIKRITKSESKIDYINWKEEDIELRIPNISPIMSIGFIPSVDLENGIKRTVDHYAA